MQPAERPVASESTDIMRSRNGVMVLGAGVAGAAIACELHRVGRLGALISPSSLEGSSHTNQKWLHSGALYPSSKVILEAWQQFRDMRPGIKKHVVAKNDSARFLAVHPETILKRKERFEKPEITDSGFKVRDLSKQEYSSIGSVGRTNANAGLGAKDLVISFPALIRELIESIPAERVLLKHEAITVETGGSPRRVTAIRCRTASGEKVIQCDRCVLAAGAWTPLILAQSGITLDRPLVRKKCTVITFDRELVPGITVCYDIKHFDPAEKELVEADVSLVPYNGQTLAAGTGWARLSEEQEPRTVQPTEDEVNELLAELYQAFPLLRRFPGTPHTCIKTELDTGGGPPNVLPKVFDQSEHGVDGLLVALPGKASLMFDLAARVLDKVQVPTS